MLYKLYSHFTMSVSPSLDDLSIILRMLDKPCYASYMAEQRWPIRERCGPGHFDRRTDVTTVRGDRKSVTYDIWRITRNGMPARPAHRYAYGTSKPELRPVVPHGE